MDSELKLTEAAKELCARLLKYYCPDDLAVAVAALDAYGTRKFNEGYDCGFAQARPPQGEKQ